jgi:hypothetical protein
VPDHPDLRRGAGKGIVILTANRCPFWIINAHDGPATPLPVWSATNQPPKLKNQALQSRPKEFCNTITPEADMQAAGIFVGILRLLIIARPNFKPSCWGFRCPS